MPWILQELALNTISENNHWQIQNLVAEHKILVNGSFGQFVVEYPSAQAVEQLKQYVSTFSRIEPWMQHCAVDGRKRWHIQGTLDPFD